MSLETANAIIQYGETGVSIAVLALVYGKYRKNTLTTQWLKKAAWFVALFFAAITLVKIGGRYYFLITEPFGKLMLPPYQSWAWFAQTALQKYLAPYAFALLGGALLYFAAVRTNRYFGGELFLPHDKYILFMAAFMTGWPGFILYLACVVILAVLSSVFFSLKQKSLAMRVVLTVPLFLSVPIVLLFGAAVAPYVNLWKLTI